MICISAFELFVGNTVYHTDYFLFFAAAINSEDLISHQRVNGLMNSNTESYRQNRGGLTIQRPFHFTLQVIQTHLPAVLNHDLFYSLSSLLPASHGRCHSDPSPRSQTPHTHVYFTYSIQSYCKSEWRFISPFTRFSKSPLYSSSSPSIPTSGSTTETLINEESIPFKTFSTYS